MSLSALQLPATKWENHVPCRQCDTQYVKLTKKFVCIILFGDTFVSSILGYHCINTHTHRPLRGRQFEQPASGELQNKHFVLRLPAPCLRKFSHPRTYPLASRWDGGTRREHWNLTLCLVPAFSFLFESRDKDCKQASQESNSSLPHGGRDPGA